MLKNTMERPVANGRSGAGAVLASVLAMLVSVMAFGSVAHAQSTYLKSESALGMTPITGGTVVFSSDSGLGGGIGDDSASIVQLPFPFKFYGTTYTSASVNTNGLLVFGTSTATNYINAVIPSTATPNAYIALFWDDGQVYASTVTPPAGFLGGTYRTVVSHSVSGTAPGRIWTMEYLYLTRRDTNRSEMSGQIRLHENGSIELFFATGQTWHPAGVTATIGIENQTGTSGVDCTGLGINNAAPPTVNYRLDPVYPLGFFSNFEASDGLSDGWSVSAVAPYSTWEWGTPATFGGPLTGANSSTNAWTVNRTGTYVNYTDTKLTSPLISLSGAITPLLTFQMNMGCEADYDGGMFQLSRNGGPWVTVNRTDPGYMSGAPNTSLIDVSQLPGWSGTVPSATGYQEVKLNLFTLTTAGLSGMTTSDLVQARFWFQSDFTVTGRGWTIDDFRLDNPPQDDIGVTVINSPTTGGGNRTATDVTITITNFGGTAQSSFPVSYQITAGPGGAGSLVTETYNGGTIQPATTATYTFTTKANLNTIGAYTIVASTGLGTDGNSTNNSTTKAVSTLGQVTAPYFTSFEANDGSSDGWTRGGNHSTLWQWGAIAPFTGAPSTGANGTVNAWQTGLNSNYNIVSAQAYLDTPLLVLSGMSAPRVSFFHSLFSESNWDCGVFQISRNGGAFVTVSNTDAGWVENGPNSAGISGLLGVPNWNGTQPSPAGSYMRTSINLYQLTTAGLTGISASDSLQVRFWFSSDSFGSGWPGWTVDDFNFFDVLPSLDVQLSPGQIASDSPAPFTDLAIGGFTLTATVAQNVITSATVAVSGTVGASDVSNFKLWFDADSSGTVNTGDVQLAGPVAAVGGNVTFSGAPLAFLTAGQVARVLVTADMAASAGGKTVGLTVTGTGSFVCNPALVTGTFPIATPLKTLVAPLSYPYFNDFESGSGVSQGWATGGAHASLWQHGTPIPYTSTNGGGPSSAYSGSNVWGTSLTGNYITISAQAYLTTPLMSVAGSTDPEFSFWMHLDTEAAWDGFALQISRNGGPYVSLLVGDTGFTATGPNDSDVDGLANLAHGWSGQIPASGSGYQKVRLRLNGITTPGLTGIASNEALRFRMWFGSDSSGSDWPGLYIDDVRLGEAAKPPVVTVRVSGDLVGPGGNITVPFGSTVASRNITITAIDPEGAPVSISSTFSNTSTHNGIVTAEYSATGTSSTTIVTGQSGVFNRGGGSHVLAVSANDGEDTTNHSITINVAEALPATLSVGTHTGRLGSTVEVPVSISWPGAQAIGGVSATLTFDTAALTFVSGALAAGQDAGFTTSATAAAGVVTINVTNPAGTLALSQGAVVNLSFTVNGTAPIVTSPLTLGAFTTLYPGGMALHSAAKSNAMISSGTFTPFATPPALAISRGGFPIANGSSFSVPYKSTVASLGLAFSASDLSGESVTIATTLPANAATAGFVAGQFNASVAGNPVSASPTTGQFNTPGASYAITVEASDGFTTTSRNFTIVVGPNTNPVITVTSGPATIASGSTSTVNINQTLASLGLSINVTDADGDDVSLVGTVSNVTTQGILAAQFSSASTAAPLTVSPISGMFSVPGVTHVVNLTATDAATGTANYTFTLQTRSNDAPVISVTSALGPITNNQTVNVPFRATLASLGLQIAVSDADGDDASLSASISNVTVQGVLQAEFGRAMGASPFTVAPTSGTFSRGGVNHVVTLTAADEFQITTFTVTLAVAPNAAPTLAITSQGAGIANAQVIQVPYNTTVASLGLAITIGDAEGDPVSLVTTISNTNENQGLVLAEFNRIASAVPYTRAPIGGRFSVAGATHVFSLTADDGFEGITTRTFTVNVGQNTAPSLSFTENGQAVGANKAYGFLPGQQISLLGLGLKAEDIDLDETLTIAATINGQTIEGLSASELIVSSGLPSPLSRTLTSGTLLVDGATITVNVTVTDSGGLTATGVLTLSSASNVRIVTPSLPAMTAGAAYSASVVGAGGATPFSWSGEFPSYLSINATTGTITGNPPRSLAGEVTFSVTLTDIGNRTDTKSYTVTVNPAQSMNVELPPAGVINTPASANLLTGLDVPMSGSLITVQLPTPVSFFGQIFTSATISTKGFITFSSITSPLPSNTTLLSSLAPPNSIFLFWDNLIISSQTQIRMDLISSTQMSVDGDGPIEFVGGDSVVFTFENFGVQGSPTSSLTGQVTIEAESGNVGLNYANAGQDWSGVTATAGIKGPTADLVIDPFGAGAFLGAPPANNVVFSAPPEVILTTGSLTAATGLVPYTFAMAASGGTQPYLWTLTGAPEWLTINPSTGVLSGTPPLSTGGAAATFTVSVTDGSDTTDSGTFTLAINAGVAPVVPPAPDSGSQCSVVASSNGGVWMLLAMLGVMAALALATRRARISSAK